MADKGLSFNLVVAHRSNNKAVMGIRTMADRRGLSAVELYAFVCVCHVVYVCLSVCLLNCLMRYVGIGREIELWRMMNSFVLSNFYQILFGLTNGEG